MGRRPLEKIKPLLIIIQYRLLPQFREAVSDLEIDKLWFKFFPQIVVYNLARIEFLKREEYTHFLLLTDDVIIYQKDIDQLVKDAEETGYDVISGWFNQDLEKHREDTNFSFTMPLKPGSGHTYEQFQFEPIAPWELERSIIPVIHQGTALTLISRKVIEQIEFRNWHGFSQDVLLSYDLDKLKIKQYVDLRVRCLHLKLSDNYQFRISEVGIQKPEMVFEPKGAYRIQGSLMFLDYKDSLNLKQNKVFEPFETELIKKIVKPTDVCLDIGANIGYFTLLLSKLCDKVIAFEPDQTNFRILKQNLKLNNIENVIAQNIAVGDRYGWTYLYLCDTDNGMHRIYPSKLCTDVRISTPMVAIDSTCHKVDFIKMDIEGSEYGALVGMKNLLKINHPKMIMEFHPASMREYGADPIEVYHFLKNLGYNIYLLPDINNAISYEKLLEETDKEPTGRNIYCQK